MPCSSKLINFCFHDGWKGNDPLWKNILSFPSITVFELVLKEMLPRWGAFDFELMNPKDETALREGFLAKPTELSAGMRR